MARMRTVKPEFWVDDKIVDLSILAKLLYIGLWNFADDEGYIEASARRIKRMIFPDNDYDVAGALSELARFGMVTECDSDQGKLLHIGTFKTHQKPQHPTPSKFTGISESSPESVTTHEDSGTLMSPHQVEESSGGESRPAPAVRMSELFDQFWNAWPLKKGKKEARVAFEKAIKSGITLERILNGVENYKREIGPSPDWSKVKWPQGWLNGERWEDEPAPKVNPSGYHERPPAPEGKRYAVDVASGVPL